MDTLMSHITHFYHLSAPDFINFNGSTLVPMSPWLPSYTAADLITSSTSGSLGETLIVNYVEALKVRRLVHTAGALFSGRQPIQNAIVPGGVTTLWDATYPQSVTTSDYDKYGPYNTVDTTAKFTALLNTIRTFVDTKYLPNVQTVATHANYIKFWSQGVGCGRLLSYGEYPDTTGALLIKRGIVASGAPTTLLAFDQANIVEQIPYSWYDYPTLDAVFATNGRHPFDGVTVPNMAAGQEYSWLKAPRYGATAQVCEVGPLARVLVSNTGTVADSPSLTNLSCSALGLSPGAYTLKGMVTSVSGFLNTALGGGSAPGCLFSALGRHAARALEAKILADVAPVWLSTLGTASANCYTYTKIPKQISTGAGLAEAPRGALGHWIKIEGRKVAKYQCVVPSTWNFSPKDANGQSGPVEQALNTSNIGTSSVNQQIVNILRLVHPFDCCIACAVHVVSPEGKEKFRFAIDPDGRPSNVVVNE